MPLSPTTKLLTHSFWKTATPEAVSELVRSGAKLRAGRVVGDKVWGPLHYAAASARHAGVIQRLIECGMSVETGVSYGGSPLHVAAQYGNCKTAQALLDLGADPLARTVWGDTALDLALENSYLVKTDPKGLTRLQARIAKEAKRKAAACPF